MRFKSFFAILSISLFLFPVFGHAQTDEPPIEDPAPIPDPTDPPNDDPIPVPDPTDPPNDDPIPGPGPIDPPDDDPFPTFSNIRIQYAAHFTCGSNPTATPRVLPGQYATSINILNPKDSPVAFRKRVALTFPPSALEPGLVSDPIEDNLGPMEAIKVACDEIPAMFFAGAELPSYVHGFLIIESGRKLNVTAVYTTGTTEAVQSMDVETVRGKLVKN